MGLFDFFKSDQPEKEETPKDRYWSLTTYDSEVVNPTMEQIEAAVRNATKNVSLFATLAYNHSGLEIEAVQTTSDNESYRFEALMDDGLMYVKNDISYEEALEYFENFFKYQRVSEFKSWPIEEY